MKMAASAAASARNGEIMANQWRGENAAKESVINGWRQSENRKARKIRNGSEAWRKAMRRESGGSENGAGGNGGMAKWRNQRWRWQAGGVNMAAAWPAASASMAKSERGAEAAA
jgi:hypothetical protein